MRAPAYTLRRSGQSPSDAHDEGSLAAGGESRILQNVLWHAPAVQTPRRASGAEGVAATVAAAATAAATFSRQRAASLIEQRRAGREPKERKRNGAYFYIERIAANRRSD